MTLLEKGLRLNKLLFIIILIIIIYLLFPAMKILKAQAKLKTHYLKAQEITQAPKFTNLNKISLLHKKKNFL